MHSRHKPLIQLNFLSDFLTIDVRYFKGLRQSVAGGWEMLRRLLVTSQHGNWRRNVGFRRLELSGSFTVTRWVRHPSFNIMIGVLPSSAAN